MRSHTGFIVSGIMHAPFFQKLNKWKVKWANGTFLVWLYTTLRFLFVFRTSNKRKNRNERGSLFESNDFIIIGSSLNFRLFSTHTERIRNRFFNCLIRFFFKYLFVHLYIYTRLIDYFHFSKKNYWIVSWAKFSQQMEAHTKESHDDWYQNFLLLFQISHNWKEVLTCISKIYTDIKMVATPKKIARNSLCKQWWWFR